MAGGLEMVTLKKAQKLKKRKKELYTGLLSVEL